MPFDDQTKHASYMCHAASATIPDITAETQSSSSFPPDLLYVIFIMCWNDSPATAPLTISQVCRQWRSVALGSPKLWTTVQIDRPPSPLCRNFYQLWIDRSQGLDLTVCVNLTSQFDWSTSIPQGFEELWHSLAPTVSCWADLRVAGNKYLITCPYLNVLSATRHPTLNLVRFRVTINETACPIPIALSQMPMLEHLEIQSNLVDLSSDWFTNCKRLKVLKVLYIHSPFSYLTWSKLYNILRCTSSHLLALQIVPLHDPDHLFRRSRFNDQHPPDLPSEVLELPNLARMSLSLNTTKGLVNPSIFTPLIERIHAPAVETIDLVHVEDLGSIADFNPFPGLRRIELVDLRTAAASTELLQRYFATAFLRLSRLQSARFHSVIWPEGSEGYVTVFGEHCPELVELGFMGCGGVCEEDLRQMVAKRKASLDLKSIQSLQVINCRPLDLLDEEQAWFVAEIEEFFYFNWTSMGMNSEG